MQEGHIDLSSVSLKVGNKFPMLNVPSLYPQAERQGVQGPQLV